MSGCYNIDDNGLIQFTKSEIIVDKEPVITGLKHVMILKLNGMSKLTDHGLTKFSAVAKEIEYLEIKINKRNVVKKRKSLISSPSLRCGQIQP